MSEKEKDKTREIMDKIYAMTPEETNRLLRDHFRRLCSRKIPENETK